LNCGTTTQLGRENFMRLGIIVAIMIGLLPAEAGAVSAQLQAEPQIIAQGGSATLTWSSDGAGSCSGEGFRTGLRVSGSVTVTPAVTTQYSLTCRLTSRNQTTATTTVSVANPCPQGTALPDGCTGAPPGQPQLPNLLDTQQVLMLNIIPGSGYADGTYNWTTVGGGGAGARGTVVVSGGMLGGSDSQGYAITNAGSGYTHRPIVVVSGLSGGSGGSIKPTVYQATPHNAATPWNMPGVDYYVGIPNGTVLLDPTIQGNLPAGTRLNGSMVTITGCNVTLNGFDFTLHNTVLDVNVSGSACVTTVENSKFQANGTAFQTIAALDSLGTNGSFVFQFNDYNGLAPVGGIGSGFAVNDPIQGNWSGAGTVTLMYNWFHTFDSKIIQLTGTTPASTLIEKYNLFTDFGSCASPPCAHGEAEYTYSGGTIAYTGEYNTYILYFTVVPSSLTAPHAVQADDMQIDGVTDDHNVILVPGPQRTCSANNPNSYTAAGVIYDGAQNDPNPSSLSNVTFFDNYVDGSGAFFVWYHNTQGGATINNVTWTNNVDTGTGAACN
jgi:hypothetical protein